jgi:hypothetical protein
MSEVSKKARSDMRAKIKRITATDPHQKVDSSDWSPPEEMHAGRKVYDKAKQKSATVKVYKAGGKVQGDRGPRRRDKKARGGNADGGVPSSRFNESPVSKSAFMNAGGRAARASGGRTGCEHMARGGAMRTGNKGGDGYVEGTRPTGGRIARANGGRTRGKKATNIHINIGAQQPHPMAPPMMPPPSQVTRPPMAPPMAPPPGGPPPGAGGPPGAPGGPPMMPPSMAGGPPPQMPRARGGRTGRGMVHMEAGAGSGLGRLEKSKLQARENRSTR